MDKLLRKPVVTLLAVLIFFQPILAVHFDRRAEIKSNEKIKGLEIKKEKVPSSAKKKNKSEKSKKNGGLKSAELKAVVKKQKSILPAELEGQSATRLPDGRWLLLGGTKDGEQTASAIILDDRDKSKIVLSSQLKHARAGHTATVLPNGNVLILGGRAADGKNIAPPEIFISGENRFEEIQIDKLDLRTGHTTTLLTDGWLLITGGVNEQEQVASEIERLDAGNFERQILNVTMQETRYSHTADLQSDGTVLFKGGFDKNNTEVSFVESFNPQNGTFAVTAEKPADQFETPRISFSAPGNGDSSVSVNARPVLRFSKLIDLSTITPQTVILTGPQGEIPAGIVGAEEGRLLFIAPLAKLEANTTYNIKLSGLKDENNLLLTEIILVFKTEEFCELPKTSPPAFPVRQPEKQILDEDSWIPGDDRFKREKNNEKQNLPPALIAPSGMTGLSGRVLSLSGKPLAGATLMVQEQSTVTDAEGRFIITGLKAVQSRMVIHGETVNSPGKTFGTFEVLVDIDEGKTNILPYTIYLPVIDKQNEVSLETPTRKETVITTPRIPGMEVKIAADSVLKMPPGHGMSHQLADLNSNSEMKKIGITAIPIERPPFPLPSGIEDGLLFTLQMHGAQVAGPKGEKRSGLRFTFPNIEQLPPETRVSFWNYDSTRAGWTWYGYGTVNKDGSKVIPDAGVELSGMQCLSLMTKLFWAPDGPPPGSPGYDGDPVDLQTGLFVYEQTDLVLPDTIPIKIDRTYRPNAGASDFGIGTTHSYNMFVAGDTYNAGYLILPDGSRIRFARDQSNTTQYIYYSTETPTAFYKAEMRYLTSNEIDFDGGGWEIKMRDGTRLIFARKTIYGTILGIHQSITALHQIIDRFGNKLTLTRDENLRLNRIISPNNKWVEFSYVSDTSNSVSQIRDNTGRIVSYTYDTQNRLIKVTDVMGGESFYTYDDAGRMLTLKDARGVVNLTNEYDYAGRVKKQTSADGTTYQFAYTLNSNSKVVQTDVTNPRGLVRRMLFNDKGYPSSETFGAGRSDAWNFTYERDSVSNRMLRVTDSWNQKTAFSYDTNGNLLSTTFLEGTSDETTSSATYTNFDNVASVTDSLNRTSNFTYDGKGLLTSAKDWLDRESTFTYNERGQILTATDNLNRTSRMTYDRGTLVESEDSTGRKMRRFVDGAGRATRIFDPMGGVTKFRFNKLNRPVETTDPLGRTAALLHDAVGNVLEITDSRGGKIKYTYDAMSRPLTRTNQMNQVETYQYDAYGNLWKATDFKGQVTEFTYDVFNRITLVKYGDNSTTSYSYDEKGRVSSTTDSAGGTITYGYDTQDRVNSETTANGTVTYAFDAGDRLVSMKAPNQPLVTYGYDTADRIQSITQGTQTVSFTYDDADRRATMTYPNGIVVYYTYDTASQLKTLVYKLGTTVLGDLSFEYDARGRKTNVSGTLAEILSPTAFANATYDTSNKQTAVNSQNLTFDQNGNLTSDGMNTYTWNARDELVSMSGPSLAASFQYDGEGRRISKTVNGVTTSYTYDGEQVVEEQQTSGPLTTQLAGGLDEVFFRKTTDGTNTNVEYLLTDALGSTWGLADSSGTVNTQYKYDIFGTTQASGQSSTTNNSLQYTGRENDETGLYYYRNRYYSPSLRRFISRDPLREGAGENEYAYVGNSPTNFTDPLGLQQGAVNPFADVPGVDLLVDTQAYADDSWTIGNECLPISERRWAALRFMGRMAFDLFGGAIIGKGLKLLGRGAKLLFKAIPCNRFTRWIGKACFVKGTLIHTKNGLVPIEEIKAGDEVLSYNEKTKQTEYKSVIETYIRQTKEIVKLQIAGESKPIETTPEHPFYVRMHKARDSLTGDDDGEWRASGALQVGDEVLSASGQWQKVVSIERQAKNEQVYNFAVEDNHNYFVGGKGQLVHNVCEFDIVKYRPSSAGLENHHGVLDIWSAKNIPGYISRASGSITMALSAANHSATKAVYREWLFERTGKYVGGVVNWQQVGPREIFNLSERMFNAANVPAYARQAYYSAFNRYIYGL
jgi:RHS repeat-associated protein